MGNPVLYVNFKKQKKKKYKKSFTSTLSFLLNKLLGNTVKENHTKIIHYKKFIS